MPVRTWLGPTARIGSGRDQQLRIALVAGQISVHAGRFERGRPRCCGKGIGGRLLRGVVRGAPRNQRRAAPRHGRMNRFARQNLIDRFGGLRHHRRLRPHGLLRERRGERHRAEPEEEHTQQAPTHDLLAHVFFADEQRPANPDAGNKRFRLECNGRRATRQAKPACAAAIQEKPLAHPPCSGCFVLRGGPRFRLRAKQLVVRRNEDREVGVVDEAVGGLGDGVGDVGFDFDRGRAGRFAGLLPDLPAGLPARSSISPLHPETSPGRPETSTDRPFVSTDRK